MTGLDGDTVDVGPVSVGEPLPRSSRPSARQQAVEAVARVVRAVRFDEGVVVHSGVEDSDRVIAERILTAVAPLHAGLAVECGGLEQVESYHDAICPLFIWEHDPDLFDEQPGACGCSPVFRVPSPGAAADPQDREVKP